MENLEFDNILSFTSQSQEPTYPIKLEKFVSIGIKIFRTIGILNCYKSGQKRNLFTVYSIVILLNLMSNFISLWAYVVLRYQDKNFWLNDIWSSVTLISFSFQMMTFFPKITGLNNLINETVFNACTNISFILKRYEKKALVVCIAHSLLYLITALSIAGTYFFNIFYNFTNNCWLVPTESSSSVVKVYFVVTNLVVMMFQIGFSALFIYVVYFQEALLDYLIGVIVNATSSSNTVINAPLIKFDAQHFVDVHIFLMRLVNKTNQVFSTHMMFKVCRSYVVLSLIAIISQEPHFKIAWSLVTRWTVFIFLTWELFNFCTVAERVINKSIRLHEVVISLKLDVSHMMGNTYESTDHVDLLANTSRALEVISGVTEQPLEFHAGPFYRLSCKTFTTVLGIAVSYYLLLKSVKV